MRIISGKYKGRSISFIKTSTTRPLKDSVKENIFNIISHSNLLDIKIKGSNILDLYSGMGSFGLECISREANKTTFVEKSDKISKILIKNLNSLSKNCKATVVTDEIKNFLNKIQSEKFEIIFFDPPFADNSFIEELKLIKKKNIHKKKHIIIIHREKKSEDNLNGILDTIMIKNYGRSKIIFGILLN